MIKKFSIVLSVAIPILLTDLYLKNFLNSNFTINYKSNNFLWLRLHLTRNKGGAFGSLPGQLSILLLITILFLAILVYVIIKENNNKMFVTYGIVTGGVLGNLYERIFNGYVTDYISLRYFAVFNLADIFIVAGISYYFFLKTHE